MRGGALLAKRAKGVRVVWFEHWNASLDTALDHLPPPPGCTRDQYRELVQPCAVPKRHALVTQHETPIAIISLRRRLKKWEPVSVQVITGFVAPARDMTALRVALNALDEEVHVPFGLGSEIGDMAPRVSWPYDFVQVDLQSDYKSYWLRDKRKHYKHVRSAEKKCAGMDIRINGEGDLEWIVNRWREQWANDPEQEICAADDRTRFWKSLGTPSRASGLLGVQTVQLLDGDVRVAGVIDTYLGDEVQGQCMARLDEYRRAGPGTRALLASMEHSAAVGFKSLNMGGGGYKNLWAPVGGQRWGAVFRPAAVHLRKRLTWPVASLAPSPRLKPKSE